MRLAPWFVGAALAWLLGGCATTRDFLPASGPRASDVAALTVAQEAALPGSDAIQVIDLDPAVIRRVGDSRKSSLFSQGLPLARTPEHVLGAGDVIEIAVWEAPPAALFGVSASMSDLKTSSTSGRSLLFPDKMIDAGGSINVPFVGVLHVLGKTPAAVEAELVQRLKGKANQPQVSVRVLRNVSATVTVVGEVASSIVMPLTPRNERLLDALAAAGGTRQPVDKVSVQLTRGTSVVTMPLGQVIRSRQENVTLQAGDVVTLFNQPLSLMVLGAIARNEEISFESQGISLAQALARAGGLQDARADARGVFIFRFEDPAALANPPLALTVDGKVPIIYRIDMRQPASLFAAQAFAVRDKDVLYVSNAPAAELQKFLNIALSMAYPLLTVVNAVK
jgi:polysaccharide export outer membrane protein